MTSGAGGAADPEIRRHLAYGKGLMDQIRVERLTGNVRCRREGRPPPYPVPEKQDALGELAREIRLIERDQPVARDRQSSQTK